MAEFLSRRDVDFLLYEWLDVVELTKRDHFAEHSRDTFDAVIDLSADIATKCFAPHNKKGDQNGPSVGADGKVVLIDEIKDALDTFSEAGLLAESPADKGYRFTLLGESKVQGKPAAGLKVACPEQRDVCLWFDRESGLLVKRGR